MNNVALVGLLGLVLSLTVTSCDVLQVEPSQSISAERAFNTQGGFEAVLISLYDDLQSQGRYGQNFMLYPDALADNIVNLPGVVRYNQVPYNVRGVHLTNWGGIYGSINKANSILGALDNLESGNARARIEGETRCLRALNYFDLVRTKAYEPGVVIKGLDEGVPIKTEPTESIEDALADVSRAPVDSVYMQIESDLQQAVDLLGEAPPLASASQGSDEKYVANEAAAQALLAQVYLYWKRYEDAASMATEAMQTAQNLLNVDLNTEDEFVQALSGPNNPGSVFALELDPNQDGAVTGSGESLSALTNDYDGFVFQVIPTQDLLDAHQEEDVRLELYSTTPNGNPYINKYTQANGTYTDNIPITRYAEVLLTRAEARAENGDVSGAQEDLNTLRMERGLGSVSPTGQALIDEILHQRRLEFAFEGERFFDLKRRGRDIPKPQAPAEAPALSYTDYRILAPLPEQEVEETDLCQNPEYSGETCV